MTICTLGPKGTDSYNALLYWCRKNNNKFYNVKLFNTFELLFENLQKNEYIIMPVGYSNRNNSRMANWVDYHFKYMDNLKLITQFSLNTKEMILIENKDYLINKAIIHSSTYQFLLNTNINYDGIDFCDSKVKAFELFCDNKYKYVICSKDVALSSDFYNKTNKNSYKIIKKFRPTMIWAVYKVKEEI